ncbi:MAG: argininosuccinate lyase [Treponema sp.]|nr:argininosuccinate lyase [Treponema sp.]
MSRLNKVHVLMLDKQRLLDPQSAAALLRGLLEIEKAGPQSIPLNPELEDYYFNVEKKVIDLLGQEIGGKLHTARSRNDLNATLIRMNVRDYMIRLYPMILELRETLLKLGTEHAESFCTGYTHMQPAQPITFGFYFTALAQAVERDYRRLEEAYGRLNICPLGAAAFAGTIFPIDRHYTAGLLGFDKVIKNTMDAVAARDFLLELASDFAILGSTLSRFANDLYVWSTDEFRIIEVDDSMAICSSIMPQKKNPVALEHIKSKSAHILASVVSVFTCLRGAPYSHARDVSSESAHLFWDGAAELEAMVQLLTATLKTLIIHTQRAAERIDVNYSTVTELADYLAARENINFRAAHQIVGNLTGNCISRGLSTRDITPEALAETSEFFVGKRVIVNEELLKVILNGRHSVEQRTGEGSPAPESCRRLISEMTEACREDRKRYGEISDRLREGNEGLDRAVSALLSGTNESRS